MIKKQARIAIICSTLILSFLPIRTASPATELLNLFTKGQKKLAKTLGPFSSIVVDFLPPIFVIKAGGKERAAQLITKYKKLTLDTLITQQLLKEIHKEIKNAPTVKKAALAIPTRLIRFRNKKKRKKLLQLEAQYPELKEIGLVRWAIRYFLKERTGLMPSLLGIVKKLQLKIEKVVIPTTEGVAPVCSALIFSCQPARAAEHPVLEAMTTFKKSEKRLDKLLGPFANIVAEFLPTLVAKAGGKEEAAQLITKHKKLMLYSLIIRQILKEIESEIISAPQVKKAILATPIKLIQLKNAQMQAELEMMETRYPELKNIGLIRWGLRYFMGGSEALIPMFQELRKL